MIWDIEFANKNYEVQGQPISRQCLKHIHSTDAKEQKNEDVLMNTLVEDAKLEWRYKGDEKWRKDFNFLNQKMLDQFFAELISMSLCDIKITLRQEKN